jgi:glucose-6-phosphate isomerase
MTHTDTGSDTPLGRSGRAGSDLRSTQEDDPSDRPYVFDIALPGGRPNRPGRHLRRHLSALRGYFADGAAYEALLAVQGDVLLYEVLEMDRPTVAGEVLHGTSILHPGKVGDEYFMTKGHFHAVLETGEVYHCLAGDGMMVMETPEGAWAVERFRPGTVLYVPPRWAHRSVNTGRDADLVTLFAYPGNAGHDYATIEGRGFRKLVVERDGAPAVIDNPRWRGVTPR